MEPEAMLQKQPDTQAQPTLKQPAAVATVATNMIRTGTRVLGKGHCKSGMSMDVEGGSGSISTPSLLVHFRGQTH